MALKKITDAKQLKQGKQYFLTDQFSAVVTYFLEVKPAKAKPGDWTTGEIPNAQFTNTNFYKHDRFELFDDLKKHKIQIYEVKTNE